MENNYIKVLKLKSMIKLEQHREFVAIKQVKLKTYFVGLYICTVCGIIMDRDINASKNLLKLVM